MVYTTCVILIPNLAKKKPSRNWMYKMNQYRNLRCKPKT